MRTILNRIQYYLAAVLIITLLALSGWAYYRDVQADRAQRDAMLQTSRADAAETYNAGFRTVVIERERNNERVQEVLKDNEEWSSGSVPSDVADLLRHDSGTGRAVP